MTKTNIVKTTLCAVLLAESASADTEFLSLAPSYIPSYFGLGVGSYPDYVGSDENAVGVAPFGRYSFGDQRYVSLEVNYASINLIEDRNWRFGPAGMWRFGREDVDDEVINRLPEVDDSLDLGFFVGYEGVGTDPRDRWTVSGSFLHGVAGGNDGYTVAASLRRWMPVGKYSAFGLAIGTTYGSNDYMDTYFSVNVRGAADSGLAVFDAGSGVRDVRVMAIFMQPLSKTWVLGAGALYSRLMNDAADTPIVSERGDRDQIVFGIAIARGF